MSTRLLIAAAASSLVGVLGPGVAGAAPTPKYTVTCVVGDTTVARWQRVSLGQVAIAWSGPAGSAETYRGVTASVTSRPPHGVVTAGTPLGDGGVPAASATVTFTPAGGGTPDVLTVSCN